MYKLTKGAVSRIRKTKAEARELIKDGYTMDGEVNENYEIINAHPVLDAPKKAKKK
jgi:hypothetical protein